MLRRAAFFRCHVKRSTPRARNSAGKRYCVRGVPHSVSTKSCLPFSSAVSQLRLSDYGGDHARDANVAPHVNPVVSKGKRCKGSAEKHTGDATKKERTRRRVAADELMRVFAISDDCFHKTLRELNVDRASSSDEHQYRRFYTDSLPVFGAMLSGDDEDALAEVGLSTASVTGILDEFTAGESIGNGKRKLGFSHKYREATKRVKEKEELCSTLERLRKRHEMKDAQWIVEKEKLKQMELEQTRETDHVAALEEKVTSTQSMLPLLQDADMDELDEIERDLMNALSQLDTMTNSKIRADDVTAQKSKTAEAKAAASRLANRVRAQETMIRELAWPISKDEFQSTTDKIARTAQRFAPALAQFITLRHDDFVKYRDLTAHTDLTRPHEWYLRARLDKRKIIFHAGPTNSGKTYQALERLKRAQKGMYLAPLRLLAAEAYENLNAEGVYTSLLTGQEKRDVPFATHRSSTVELVSLEEDFDCVVIDEVQMMRDEHRGFAWTRALLGARCKEIHVCGGAEAIDIVRKICHMCGDTFELHRYARFSELKVLDNSVARSPTSKGAYVNVQAGDCVVAFSRRDIFAIKREIEENTSFKCCVIYGSLPPEVRAEQARRFNDPSSEYEILVASDAIGMGLNLSIKRIIFNSMIKHNGDRIVQLDHSHVVQIAGRAGRRNSPYPHGEVTCRDPNDMAHLKRCIGSEIKPLRKAGIIPTPSHIAQFNQHLVEHRTSAKEIGLHQTLQKFSEMATLKGDFFLCRERSMEVVSRWLKDINMSPADKFVICTAPLNENCVKSRSTLMRYLEKYTNNEVPGLSYSMQPKAAKSLDNLEDLCSVHHQLELFLWLHNKYPSNFVEAYRAAILKDRTSDMINKCLGAADRLSLKHDYVFSDTRKKKAWAIAKQNAE